MTFSLLSLPQELFNYIINYLPRKYVSTLLATSKYTYMKGTYAFNKSCFYIIPVKLLYKGLRNTKKILNNIYTKYIHIICFKVSKYQFRDNFTEINNCFILILIKVL